MDDAVLWMIAVGSGLLGLLLLTLAGAVALYWKIVTPVPSRKPQSRAEMPSAGGERQPVAASAVSGSPWLWIKAWIFAMIHAGTVSVVLGGITFFEDIARASDEIQRSGTVTFPRQLLPGALSEASANRRLPRPEGKGHAPGEGTMKPARSAALSRSATWEVVGDESES
ncbi:MAG: hypothetical protein N2508_16805 [Anaerolineae bacterium]|nr:hypothetical protein [Anaerolineae bacterium]